MVCLCHFVLFAISAFRHPAFADRPHHAFVLAADEHRNSAAGAPWPSTDALCPQETPLRRVLEQLGFAVAARSLNSTQLRELRGVWWRGCSVVDIRQGTIFSNMWQDRQGPGTLDESITQLTELEKVFLYGNVTGDLEHFGKLKNLRWLDAKHTNIFGDLAALENLQLESLYLGRTQVTGNLRFLSNSPLRILDLADTLVEGDLASLPARSRRSLHSLRLGNTKVTGDIMALRKSKQMTSLRVSNTKIYGEVKALSDMVRLRFIEAAGCNISGDIMSMIPTWKKITRIDLSHSAVHGETGPRWETCCRELTSFKLANSKVKFMPNEDRRWVRLKMPKLHVLDLGGCPLNCPLIELLTLLRDCQSLAIIQASNCGLNMELINLNVFSHPALIRSLVSLDVASNQISRVSWIPPNCRTIVLANNPTMSFEEGLIRKAVEGNIFLDLQNVTFTNQTETAKLFSEKVLQKTQQKTTFNQEAGYECYGVTAPSLQVQPDQFAPETLCSCSPGWTGRGARCSKCPRDFFRAAGDADCVACPEGSAAPEGSTSRDACRCRVGEVYEQNSTWSCGCVKGQALYGEGCVKCDSLHLNCSQPGSEVYSALPLQGFTRLTFRNKTQAYQCLPPKARCDADQAAVRNLLDSGDCNYGYTGLMCMECDANYFATANRCEKCHDVSGAATKWQIVSVVTAVTLMAFGLGFWRYRTGDIGDAQKKGSASQVLTEQVKAQAPILLQTCQLWVVLASLSQLSVSRETEPQTTLGDSETNFWEVPYLKAVQLSVADLKNAWNLQCRYGDGSSVGFATALAAPVFPLLVLLGCAALEIFRPGNGITAALQVITLLYIGGASSCWNLLSCQETDGAGEVLRELFAFRKSMPYIRCHETSQLKTAVDLVGFSCAFCYAVLIPGCLLYLYARQHVILGSSRTTVATVETDPGNLKVSLHDVRKTRDTSLDLDGVKAVKADGYESSRRLVAAAAAYIAVLLRGPVTLRLADGVALVALLEDRENRAGLDFAAVDFAEVLGEGRKQQALTLRCRAITEMLLERCVLQEQKMDRVLSGAKHLLLKYTSCRNLWMEIVQKLLAVALVSVVASADGLQLSLAITLGMAAAVGMVQPYSQPQANSLQCVSFAALGAAALGFRLGVAWLPRLALLLPLGAALTAAAAPDSSEALATRLWEDLEPQLEELRQGETVEVQAETYSFI